MSKYITIPKQYLTEAQLTTQLTKGARVSNDGNELLCTVGQNDLDTFFGMEDSVVTMDDCIMLSEVEANALILTSNWAQPESE